MPDQHHELHHKICNLRYGTHGYEMSTYKKGRIREYPKVCVNLQTDVR